MTELTSRLEHLAKLIIENKKLHKRLNTLKYYDTSKLKKAKEQGRKDKEEELRGEINKIKSYKILMPKMYSFDEVKELLNENYIYTIDEMVNRLILDFDLTKEDVKQVRKLAEEMKTK